MASLAMVVSELAHSLQQPNNKALRENLKLLVVQTRNECIRRSFENHGYIDKELTQRFRVNLIDVNDGDIEVPSNVDITKIKRTKQQVPRPVRLVNNLPFDRVSTVGFKNNREIPFIKETTARFRGSVPGLCGMPCYDYINEFLYIFPADNKVLNFNKIIIEAAFEHPNYIAVNNGTIDGFDAYMDENEYLISEDMLGQIKDIIYKRDLLATVRETNETPSTIQYAS